MTPLIACMVGLAGGTLSTALVAMLLARRRRAALVREFVDRVGPILERRGAALGLAESLSPEVNVGLDGDLEIRDADQYTRVLRLAEAIDNREQSQLGYLDTIRISKDSVDEHVRQRTGERAKG